MSIHRSNSKKIYVVIPLFNHNEIHVINFLSEIVSAGFLPIVVNNNVSQLSFAAAVTINNYFNCGIAKALNQGVKYALEKNADQIILFDQDSFLCAEELNVLSGSASILFANDEKIAAAGPMFFEKNSNQLHGFAQYGLFKIKKVVTKTPAVTCVYLITSGTVLHPKCLENVGLMDESLFIDYVDVEWCLRATSLGYKIYGMPNVLLNHEVGYFKRRFLCYQVPYHSQFRLYYQTRNSILMYMRGYIPARWKFCDIIYFFKRSFFYIYIDRDSVKTIFKAISDAIKSK